jgi:hypothetical protein
MRRFQTISEFSHSLGRKPAFSAELRPSCAVRIWTRAMKNRHMTEEQAGAQTRTSRVIKARPKELYAAFLDPGRSDRLAPSGRGEGRDPRIRRACRGRISDVAVLPAESARCSRKDRIRAQPSRALTSSSRGRRVGLGLCPSHRGSPYPRVFWRLLRRHGWRSRCISCRRRAVRAESPR